MSLPQIFKEGYGIGWIVAVISAGASNGGQWPGVMPDQYYCIIGI
jgi:hypothetical protein